MKFYDREEELKILGKNREMSVKKGGMFTVITGRRRIGKTALIKESEKDEKMLYFFASRRNEAALCERLAQNTKTNLGLSLADSGRFHDLFMQLMRYGMDNAFTFVIDEFQELEKVNRSILSSIQELWDEYGERSKVNLIVCGSVHSMMVRIFQDQKEPLFGRATSILTLRPFRPSVLKEILKDHHPGYAPNDLLFLYAVTGGVPKYVRLLMDSEATTAEKMTEYICSEDSLFITEGKNLLISEFGKDHGTYFTVLRAIAKGKNTLKEISDMTGKETGPYLDNLENRYGMVRKFRPIFSKNNSRDVRWQISDNYLRFYFKFIEGDISATEFGKFDVLKKSIISGFEEYSGIALEDYFKEKMIEEEEFNRMGSYWDRKGENEIDIILLNDHDKTAIVTEVKRDPKKASMNKLREKAETAQGLKGYDAEYRILSLKDM